MVEPAGRWVVTGRRWLRRGRAWPAPASPLAAPPKRVARIEREDVAAIAALAEEGSPCDVGPPAGRGAGRSSLAEQPLAAPRLGRQRGGEADQLGE
ncbi:MAG: hypothetical protein EA356_09430 [Geminicoccaceae bacterium]|nr:MAG: hypothetical protein EA356_09430 [Geminicoccaceae bacterium]